MLAAVDERKSRVVELPFFGGLSVDETAEVCSRHGVARLEFGQGVAFARDESARESGLGVTAYALAMSDPASDASFKWGLDR